MSKRKSDAPKIVRRVQFKDIVLSKTPTDMGELQLTEQTAKKLDEASEAWLKEHGDEYITIPTSHGGSISSMVIGQDDD